MGFDDGHDFINHGSTDVACPREPLQGIGKQRLHVGVFFQSSPHKLTAVAMAQQDIHGLIQVANGSRNSPYLKFRANRAEATKGQLDQYAPFASHQLMPFVDDYELQTAKKIAIAL